MFCAPLSRTVNQVWPGNAIDVFSATGKNVRVSVVSTFSNYLNFERWYFTASANRRAEGVDDQLIFKPALPRRVRSDEGPASCDFAESYIDRAVLTDLDWRGYAAPVVPPVGYQEETYRACLRPVRLPTPGSENIVVGNPIDVWLQFWRRAEDLVQIDWYFGEPLPSIGLPSAFECPADGAGFERVGADTLPRSGWVYSGGLRPAPWPA
jgi:hypothetical protein